MNLILVSHCNFLGNSAMHVFSLAQNLTALGHECLVLVPDQPETVRKHGKPNFKVATYQAALDGPVRFANGAGPDFVHAWTPRDHVRRTVLALCDTFGCRYLVHMEDHEEQIVSDETPRLAFETIVALPDDTISAIIGTDHRSHPREAERFIARAVGFTCLIDALERFAAKGQPTLTFWPGFDEAFAESASTRASTRKKYGFASDETVILYSGNVHLSIAEDVAALYGAVALLRRRGRKVRLVRTGWDYAPLGLDEAAKGLMGVLDLGFIPRADLAPLLAACDILVQPGKVNAFNLHRFPSKLPEFLVSGHPVILPDVNVGRELKDGVEAFKLKSGDLFDIADSIERVMKLPDRGAAVGRAGRAFALKRLTWATAAKALDQFYKTLEAKRSKSRPRTKSIPAPKASVRTPEFPVDLIAFYLPQFHAIPENDAWWGKGFTEWTNVVRAPRNFAGHDQPRLPTDLGFYDLRLPEVMHAQADLARQHGVTGFCFYHYWFDGRRLLETPLDNWLEHGPDFPFSICWANEPWSRRWDGSDAELLLDQTYADGFAEAFINDVLPILKDPRYIRLDGAPVLMIYKISDLPDPIATVATWRRIAREQGVDHLHVVAVQSFDIRDPRPYGADAAVEFLPSHIDRMLLDPQKVGQINDGFDGYLEDYVSSAMRAINAPPVDYVRYRGVFPRWDNTARRKHAGHTFINDTTKAYANWLRFLTWEALERKEQQAPMIFINAWNEWAEGTYLEPDETYGQGLLTVTRAALSEGVIDYAKGRSPERDRAFNAAVSLIPSRTPA
ncbi:hypothetical protein BH10PSE1_BH10PSE1_11100 [soil metagenome]